MSGKLVKSTIILAIATFISKVLGSVFRIPLQNIAGDEVLGIFSLVYPVYMVALTLSVAGIPIAISKLISEALAKQDENMIRDIFVTASILAVSFGVISFTIMYLFSEPLAEILGGQSTWLSIVIVSVTLLIAPYMAVYRGLFQGFQDMRPTAISQVIEQFIRVTLILIIAYYLVQQNKTNDVIAGGVMVGSSVGALCSLLFLRWKFTRSSIKPRSRLPYTLHTFRKMSKIILKISLPICVGAITMALLNFVDSMTIPNSLKSFGRNPNEINYLYGIYGRGLALVQIATVVSTAIVLPLIPLITENIVKKKHKETKRVIIKAHDLTHFISWPAAFGLLALTLPLNLTLFKNIEGSMAIAIIVFSSLFTSLTVLGTGVLQGMNRSNTAAIIIVIAVVLKVIMNFIFVKMFGLVGAAISTTLIYILTFIINTYAIRRQIPFPIWGRKTTVFAVSSIVMALVVGAPTLFLNIASWGRFSALMYTIFGVIVGATIYAGLVILMKGIEKETVYIIPGIGPLLQKLQKRQQT